MAVHYDASTRTLITRFIDSFQRPYFRLYSCEIRYGRVPLIHPRLTVSRKLNRLRKTRESRFLTAKAVRNDKKVKVLAVPVSSCPPQEASKRDFSAAL